MLRYNALGSDVVPGFTANSSVPSSHHAADIARDDGAAALMLVLGKPIARGVQHGWHHNQVWLRSLEEKMPC